MVSRCDRVGNNDHSKLSTLWGIHGGSGCTSRARSRWNFGAAIAELAQATGSDALIAEVAVMPGSPDYIVNSFGAHFCEVEVDTATGRVRTKPLCGLP